MPKITIVGAGSLAWGPTIAIDVLLNPSLTGVEIALMDINADALARVKRLIDRIMAERELRATVTATTDLSDALRGSRYAVVAISVGGDHLWRYDAMFPQIYGVFQPVGDTIGPGGLMRTLRHAPPLLEVGRRLLKVGAPDPILIQLTNPMNPLCAALDSLDGLTVYGICHGAADTEDFIAKQLGAPREDVRIEAAGNNHFIFCDRVKIAGEVYDQNRLHELTPAVFETPFRKEVWRRYNSLVGNHARHPMEFLPGFLTPEHDLGRAWGVSPLAREIDPAYPPRHDHARQIFEAAISQPTPIRNPASPGPTALRVAEDGQVEAGHSREGIDELIAAVEHGDELFVHVNLPNEGTIAGVSPEHNVELPITFHGGKPERRPIQFPDAVTAEIERVGKEQTLLAQACVSGDRDLLVESLALDALVPNRDIAARLVSEMTAYQRDYIPSFQP